MSKEASRIRQIVSRLKSREDILEILRMAKTEVVRGLAFGELDRYDRGVAIFDAAREELGNVSVRGQLPRYTRAA